MAISFVNSATDSLDGTGDTSFTLTSPSSTAVGDVMVAFVMWEANAAITASCTGWTEVNSVQLDGTTTQDISLTVFSRVFQSGDTTFTGTFSAASGAGWATAVHSYRGVNRTTPFIAQDTSFDNALGTVITTATVSNTNDAAWSVCAFVADEEGSWTSTEATERTEQLLTSGTADSGLATYDSNGTVASGSISRTGTTTLSSFQISWIGILRPGVDAGHASASVAANAPQARIGRLPGAPTATVTANQPTVVKQNGAGAGLVEVGVTANQPEGRVRPTLATPSAAATANQPKAHVKGLAGHVTVLVETVDPQFLEQTDPIAAEAYEPSVSIEFDAGTADATVEALNVDRPIPGGSPSAAATAVGPVAQTKALFEEVPEAVVELDRPNVSVQALAGTATAAASVGQPVASTKITAPFVEADAFTYDPVTAGLAVVSVTAYGATVLQNTVPPTRQVRIPADERVTRVAEDRRVVEVTIGTSRARIEL